MRTQWRRYKRHRTRIVRRRRLCSSVCASACSCSVSNASSKSTGCANRLCHHRRALCARSGHQTHAPNKVSHGSRVGHARDTGGERQAGSGWGTHETKSPVSGYCLPNSCAKKHKHARTTAHLVRGQARASHRNNSPRTRSASPADMIGHTCCGRADPRTSSSNANTRSVPSTGTKD